jgi:hypothetical protein
MSTNSNVVHKQEQCPYQDQYQYNYVTREQGQSLETDYTDDGEDNTGHDEGDLWAWTSWVGPTRQFRKWLTDKMRWLLGSDNEYKLRIEDWCCFTEHRSGWNYAMQALCDIHNPEGVRVIDVMEKPFSWEYDHEQAFMRNDWHDLWVGFLHNPARMPKWFDARHSAYRVLERMKRHFYHLTCKGIFVLSRDLKSQVDAWLIANGCSHIPVSVVYHPTETIPAHLCFSWDKFMHNEQKKVLQVGYWLRDIFAIQRLRCDSTMWQKKWLYGGSRSMIMLERQAHVTGVLLETFHEQVQILPHASEKAFDKLLSENVVFLKLYASSANNAIIECIMRKTPVLVNPLPSVVDYLGPEYPLYYTSEEEAASKLSNMELIHAAHKYLLHHPTLQQRITDKAFVDSVLSSEVYHSL